MTCHVFHVANASQWWHSPCSSSFKNEIKISRTDVGRLNAMPILSPSTADIKRQTKIGRVNAPLPIYFNFCVCCSSQLLANACMKGDVNTVKQLLKEGQSVHETTEEGESLLSLACSAGFHELAQVWLVAPYCLPVKFSKFCAWRIYTKCSFCLLFIWKHFVLCCLSKPVKSPIVHFMLFIFSLLSIYNCLEKSLKITYLPVSIEKHPKLLWDV